jgi:hypothetical protein
MATGGISGCLVWVLTFGVITTCLCPLAMAIGTVTSSVAANWVAGLVGPMLCPPDTTPQIHTFPTTTVDDNGVKHPATGYEMLCLGANGEVVKNAGPSYAFVWIGIVALVALVASALLAIFLAVPAGAVVARLTGRRSPRPAVSI